MRNPNDNLLFRPESGIILLAVLLSLGVGLAASEILDQAVSWGGGLVPYPGTDLPRDYVLGVLWAPVLGLSILIWPITSRDKLPLFFIWLVKAAVTLGPMLVYEYTYGIDPDGYFTNAVVNPFVWEGFSLGSGTLNIQHLAWLQNHIVPGSYHASKLTFAYVGLAAVYIIYRAGVLFVGREHRLALYTLMLYPSILFWSSVLGKDPIACLGISLYAYGVIGWYRCQRARYALILVLGIVLALFVRTWLTPILILPLCVLAWHYERRLVLRLAWTIIAPLTLLYSLNLLATVWNIGVDTDVLSFANGIARSFDTGGSTLQTPEFGSYAQLLAFLPLGMFTVLFRPLPGDVQNLFGILAGLENLLLLCLLWRAFRRTSWSEVKDPIVLWAIALIAGWACFSSVGLYQNLGTLARHKVEILPILVGTLLLLGRRRSTPRWSATSLQHR